MREKKNYRVLWEHEQFHYESVHMFGRDSGIGIGSGFRTSKVTVVVVVGGLCFEYTRDTITITLTHSKESRDVCKNHEITNLNQRKTDRKKSRMIYV